MNLAKFFLSAGALIGSGLTSPDGFKVLQPDCSPSRTGVQHFALRFAVALALLIPISQAHLSAMPPPDPGMIEQYRKDGTLKARIARAKDMGNHRVDPGLLNDAMYRLRRMTTPQEGMDILPTPPSRWGGGLPSTGTPKMLVVCIDFPDYPHNEMKNSAAILQNRIFGTGDSNGGTAPYESLTNYYKRASFNDLTIGGNVLGWYRSLQNRSAIATTTAGRQALIKEALQSYDATHDFAQYDNNSDGRIDYFAVIWSGPDTGWSEFWWAYQTSWSSSTTPLSLDGKTLGKYSWQWESRPINGYYTAKTLIHETGHSLGLPDYYDYDDTVGPQGGVGGLDMMDGNWGDHNCFSKFLLGWITPSVYTTSANGVSLRSAGDFRDAAVVMPDATAGNNFGEFFMIQNRRRVQNDTTYPTDGLLIWHVDSRLDPATGNSDYLYNNSYTSHKLLRLMEADSLEEIEAGTGGTANAGDFYQTLNTFGPTSLPNSTRYDGTQIWMGINAISAPGATMTFNVFTVAPDLTPPTGVPTAPAGFVDAANPDTPIFSWGIGTSADSQSDITGYYLQVGTTVGGSDVFDGIVGNVLTKSFAHLGADGNTYFARVRAMNGAALYTGWSDNSAGLSINYPAFTCATVDACNLTFKTIGPWTDQTTTKLYGISAAQSAAIGDNASTLLQTTIVGPGTFSFNWQVSCEAPQSATVFYDNLAVSIDGVVKNRIGGEVDWTPDSYEIPVGSHVVRWTYTKDPNTVEGSDAGWVDHVIWAPTANATATISPATYTALVGAVRPFTATVANYLSNSNVDWTISGSGGTFTPTQTASGDATSLTTTSTAGSYTITATPVETLRTVGTASLTLVAPESVSVGVAGSAATVLLNAEVTFTAAVTPLTDTSVTWTKDSGTFGTPTGNTIPWSSATAGTFNVTATSAVATGRSNSASITVIDPAAITISVNHTSATLVPGATQALVGTTSYGAIAWTKTGLGTLSATSGGTNTFTAPASASVLTDLTTTVTLTNSLNSAKIATCTITVKTLDVNRDGAFDLQDLLTLAMDWGTTATRSDLSGDATVGQADLTLLLASF